MDQSAPRVSAIYSQHPCPWSNVNGSSWLCAEHLHVSVANERALQRTHKPGPEPGSHTAVELNITLTSPIDAFRRFLVHGGSCLDLSFWPAGLPLRTLDSNGTTMVEILYRIAERFTVQ